MQRHKHNLSHYRLATLDMGRLLPVAALEVLPGDSFRHSVSALMRVATLTAPLMHPVNVRVHTFFVPNRLIWDDWEDFITGQVDTTVPTVTTSSAGPGYELTSALGIPEVDNLEFNALPLRAYNFIWNEYFRDQNLQSEVDLDQRWPLSCCWEKDYFTTARTQPQDGAEVSVELGGAFSDQEYLGVENLWGKGQPSNQTVTDAHGYGGDDRSIGINGDDDHWSGSNLYMTEDPNNPGYPGARVANPTYGTGVLTVQELRRAMALQKFSERRNRFGSRYADYLRYLGIRPSDGRLDRPEYLGGGKSTISFSEVLATAEGTNTNLGDVAGHGIAALKTRPYKRFFEEHGYVITVMSVRPKSIYASNLPRKFLRRDMEDFWQKELEVLPTQTITKREVYAAHPNDTDVFGHIDRYREYREEPSSIAGAFRRSEYANWHLARQYSSSPSLNGSWVECNPSNRIFAATDYPQLLTMCQHRISARRLVGKRAQK